MPWVAPTSKTSRPSSALRTDDLPRLTMPNAAISMVVSSSFLLSSRSWRISSAIARSSAGVSLRPERVDSRLSRARSTASLEGRTGRNRGLIELLHHGRALPSR